MGVVGVRQALVVVREDGRLPRLVLPLVGAPEVRLGGGLVVEHVCVSMDWNGDRRPKDTDRPTRDTERDKRPVSVCLPWLPRSWRGTRA